MTLAPGTRLGPYEIQAAIGAGGMGEVYRAEDTRLDREVAIKVLPAHVSSDPERRARFAREAKTIAGLNHPNVCALFDVGEAIPTHPQDRTDHPGASVSFLVMELLDGETLRQKLIGKPLPARRAVEIAAGVAEGLSAAHTAGIIHRDLKPENVFVMRDGRVKVLDFGLAKPWAALGSEAAPPDELPTGQVSHRAVETEAGTVLGTVGYMSPEQVRGEALDARSDLFALGVICWEMLTGERPFKEPTAAEAMTAVLKDEPPELDPALKVPPVLERIVRTALAKEPAARFHSAHDLAFALATIGSGSQALPAVTPRRRWRVWLWAALAGALLLSAGLAIGRWTSATGPQTVPSFLKLTFGRGAIDGARFVPGSRDIVYSARWHGAPSTVYLLREGSVEPRALEAPGAVLLAASVRGEAAVMTRGTLNNGLLEGTVSILPLAGGGAREISRSGASADFSADGSGLCLATRVGTDNYQLEWPQGTVFLKPGSFMPRSPRVRGAGIAYFQSTKAVHSDGDVYVAGQGNPPRRLAPCRGFTGLAWGPDGSEIWYSTFDGSESQIHAVSLSGRTRVLARYPGRLELVDVDAAGRSLAIASSQVRQAFGRAPGSDREVDLTWLDAQTPVAISADGKQVLVTRSGDWEMSAHANLYLRPLDRSPAIKLGTGSLAADLSPDGRWVATLDDDGKGQSGVRLIPVGAGASRWFPLAGAAANADTVWFHPSSTSLYLLEEVTNTLSRLDLATGALSPRFIPESVSFFQGQNPVSPDGRRLLVLNYESSESPDGRPFHFLLVEAERTIPVPPKGYLDSEVPASWADNNREVYLYDRNVIPAPVVRWDPATGARRPLFQVVPADPSGIWGISTLTITPSGSAYAYSIIRKLSELYLIEGLK